MEAKDQSVNLVKSVAEAAGVSAEDAHKVLKTLGVDDLARNVQEVAGAERLEKLSLGELKIAARLGRSSLVV